MLTSIDWWAWRTQSDVRAVAAALGGVFETWCSRSPSGAQVQVVERDGGMIGYDRSANVMLGEMAIGRVAWGGEHQKGWTYVSLGGTGCQFVEDWGHAEQEAAKLIAYELKRVDIAADRFDPQVGYDECVAAYRAGGFSSGGRGRPPKAHRHEPESPWEGRTLYVGNRQGDKFFRGYEKGLQLLGPALTAALRRGADECEMEKLSSERVIRDDKWVRLVDWFRYEVEFKPKTCPLPEDLIERRDQYFSGSYPYLSHILDGVEPEPLVLRRQRGPQVALEAALDWVRRGGAGAIIETAIACYNGDLMRVMDRVRAHKMSDALIQAGVLEVEHD